METKLKERLHRISQLGLVKDIQSFRRRVAGIIVENASETEPNFAAYEASEAYKAEMAEIEIKKSAALSEARRQYLH